MTPKEKLICVNEKYNKKQVIELLRANRIEKVLIKNKKSTQRYDNF